MAYTDTYGRTWQFRPGHDVSCMLQLTEVETKTALAISDFARGAETLDTDTVWGINLPVDCYLLRLNNGWVMGARYGDQPHEYIGFHLVQPALDTLVYHHGRISTKTEAEVFRLLNP